ADYYGNPTVRASANGQVFAMFSQHSPLETLVLQGGEVRGYMDRDASGYSVPGPDGRVIYTGTGTLSWDLKRLGPSADHGATVPALQGDYYLRLVGGGVA